MPLSQSKEMFRTALTAERERLATAAKPAPVAVSARDRGRQGAHGCRRRGAGARRSLGGAVDQRRGPPPAARLGRHRGHNELHQHVEPVGHAGGGTACAERGEARPQEQAVGEDVAGAGIEGRDRLLQPLRRDGRPREARLRPGRLRLHDVHRQFRTAPRRHLEGDRRRAAHRGRRAVREPELRGTRQSADALQLPRVAAAGRGVRAGGKDGHRPRARAVRHRERTARSSCATSGRRRRRSRTKSCAR